MRFDPMTQAIVLCVALVTSVTAALFGLEIVIQIFLWLR